MNVVLQKLSSRLQLVNALFWGLMPKVHCELVVKMFFNHCPSHNVPFLWVLLLLSSL